MIIVRSAVLVLLCSATLAACSCGGEPPVEPGDPESLVPDSGQPGTLTDGGEDPEPLTLELGPDLETCAGGSLTLGPPAQAGLSYSWSPATGLSDPSIAQPTASPGATALYTLTVTDTATDRVATDSLTITVHANPIVSAGADKSMGLGGRVTLNGAATEGLAPYLIDWSSTDPGCSAGTCLSDRSVLEPQVFPSMTSLFSLQVTDSRGCVGSDSVEVSVVEALVANAGQDVSICEGDSMAIGAEATGGVAPYAYLWTATPDCAAGTCLSDPSQATPTVSPAAVTVFTQAVSDQAGSTASAFLTVTPLPDPGTAGADQYLVPGSPVQVGPTAIAGGSYGWSCNRADCALSDPSAAQPMIAPTLSTNYTLTASSGPGCVKTSSFTAWAPLQLSVTPADGTTNFPASAKLMVRFEQSMDPASLTASTVVLEDANASPISTTLTWDAVTRVLTIQPTDPAYVAGQDYTLKLASGPTGILSDDPILPHVLEHDLLLDFTTAGADTTPAGLEARAPLSSAVGVSLTTAIIARFDEDVVPGSVTATTFQLSSALGSVSGALSYDAATRTVMFRPDVPLDPDTGYTVLVNGVIDLSGNVTVISWSFTTGGLPDLTPPVVSSVIPLDAAVSVYSASTVQVKFSEQLDPSSLSGFTVARQSDGARVVGAIRYDANTFTVTFTPARPFEGDTLFQVEVIGVRDLSQNALAQAFTSTFTTRPTLFWDDLESGASNWVTSGNAASPWATSTQFFSSASHSLTDSVIGKYAANTQTLATLATPVPVTGYTNVSLRFSLRTRTEKNRDYVYLEVRRDGGAWELIPKPGTSTGWSGNGGWSIVDLNLPTNAASTFELRFRFESNNNKQQDGVYLDDVLIQAF